MKEKVIQELLKSTGYISVNKLLIKKLGLKAAVFLSELFSKRSYFESQDKLFKNWFFNSVEDMKLSTGLSSYEQKNSIDTLEKLKLIDYTVKGMPHKRFFRINFGKVESFLDE